jgi:hypothetical protein
MIERAPHSSPNFLTNVQAVEIWDHSLSPVAADLRVRFSFKMSAVGLDLRGRLVGPRCRYASTVEVAYPFRPLPPTAADAQTLSARVVVPEPCFWEPACPFLYEGFVEVCRDDTLLERYPIGRGFRQVQLSPHGLRWNGQPLPLRGVSRGKLTEDDARALRESGRNTVLISLPNDPAEILDFPGVLFESVEAYESADHVGLLVLARLPAEPKSTSSFVTDLGRPSCLGWLMSGEGLLDPARRALALAHLGGRHGELLGVELNWPVPAALLEGIAFICCRDSVLRELDQLPLPKLLLIDAGSRLPEAVAGRADVLGWIEV